MDTGNQRFVGSEYLAKYHIKPPLINSPAYYGSAEGRTKTFFHAFLLYQDSSVNSSQRQYQNFIDKLSRFCYTTAVTSILGSSLPESVQRYLLDNMTQMMAPETVRSSPLSEN
jgi:hypothetical protein